MDYSTVKKFYKEWAQYKKQDITNNDETIFAFYAQEHWKNKFNENLFEDYIESDIEFNWDLISEEQGKFLVMVWNTYHGAAINKTMELMVEQEKNYKDIHDLLD